jgi:SET domain
MEVSSAWPVGNRLSTRQRLRHGLATGSLKLLTPEGAALRVTKTSHRGRGLVAARPLRAGAVVCRIHGVLVDSATRPRVKPGEELFHVRAPSPERPGRWLVLKAASSTGTLGNLLNTGDCAAENNCRLCYRAGNTYVSVKTLRNVAAGEELLASYGDEYTVQRAETAVGGNFATLKCTRCGRRLQKWQLKRHRGVACVSH